MLKGATPDYFNPTNWTSFSRTSWTQPEGARAAYVHEAKVYNVNLVNWTVDVQTVFDQKIYMDVQVSAPYLHPTSGEGFYAVPEVGAKCLVCIPSDGPPPIVISFMAPVERLPETATPEDPVGTAPAGGEPQGSGDFTYAAGRDKPKPGDIIAKGRDGNFMRLDRGGVARFGSGPLAQRICIPLTNLITDIDQNYNHFNGGGAISWGVQDRGSDDPGAEFRQTQRVYANDEFADLRFAFGRVRSPVPEPTGDAGESSNLAQLGIGTEEDTVFEFCLAKDGFETQAGEFVGDAADTKIRIFFDRGGNGMARFEGAVDLRVKGKMRVTADDDVALSCKKNISVSAEGKMELRGDKLVSVGTDGGTVQLNSGGSAVASVGSIVRVTVTVPVPIVTTLGPGTITPGAVLTGVVTTGNPTILV